MKKNCEDFFIMPFQLAFDSIFMYVLGYAWLIIIGQEVWADCMW
jgi:hypothetical protein